MMMNMFDDDAISNTVSYSFFQLNTPTVSIIEGDTLTWNYIQNATSYEIYLNNTSISTTSNSFYLESFYMLVESTVY